MDDRAIPPFPPEAWEEIVLVFARWRERKLDGCIEIVVHWRQGMPLKYQVNPRPVVTIDKWV